MLHHIERTMSLRKIRLFACAWAFHDWRLLADERSQDAVLIGEAFADSQSNTAALAEAHAAATAARAAVDPLKGGRHVRGLKSQMGEFASRRAADVARAAASPSLSIRDMTGLAVWASGTEQCFLADLIRELIGNPFQSVVGDPRWRTSDVIGLAQAIYEEKAFERMPILADALMDAGCEDEQLIAHCRGESQHVRGCWLVDLVLGNA
jgi:hypothetical protein